MSAMIKTYLFFYLIINNVVLLTYMAEFGRRVWFKTKSSGISSNLIMGIF